MLPAIYNAASVSSAEIREELDALGLPFHDPRTGRSHHRAELDDAALTLINRAARKATVRGAAGTFGGLITTAPEAVAAMVQTLRLAQRLAVLYGNDPDSDRGQLLLTRALAAAWQVELPREGAWTMNLRQLPELVRSRLPAQASRAGIPLARAIALRALVTATRRVGRVVPGFGTAVGAISARRELQAQGQRMVEVYQKAWQGEPGPAHGVVDVKEVG